MTTARPILSRPSVPPEVDVFAAEQGISQYLDPVIDLARRSFPSSVMCMSVGEDAEEAAHRYIALDVETGDLTAEELLAGQTAWSTGLGRVCPSRYAVHFVLSWR